MCWRTVVDIHGAAKAKAVARFEHREMVLTDGARWFRRLRLWGFGRIGMGQKGPDYNGGRRSLRTLQDIRGCRLCGIVGTGWSPRNPMPSAPGGVLQAQMRASLNAGITLYTGIETEFMMLSRREDGAWAQPTPRRSRQALLRYRVFTAAARCSIAVRWWPGFAAVASSIDHSRGTAPASLINFTYADELKSAG